MAGFAAASIGEDDAPGYRQIHRRMGSVKVSIKDNIIMARDKKSTINLFIDGTGLSPNARSEYIRYRHKVKHGFIRVVFVVDTDTREILAFSITDETIGEPPQFEPLACTALKNIGADEHIVETPEEKCEEEKDQMPSTVNDTQDSADKIDPEIHTQQSTDVKVLNKLNVIMRADGGFDSREIFKLCKQLKITPYIRIKHNAVTRSRGICRDKSIAVLDHLGDGIANPSDFAQLTKDEARGQL